MPSIELTTRKKCHTKFWWESERGLRMEAYPYKFTTKAKPQTFHQGNTSFLTTINIDVLRREWEIFFQGFSRLAGIRNFGFVVETLAFDDNWCKNSGWNWRNQNQWEIYPQKKINIHKCLLSFIVNNIKPLNSTGSIKSLLHCSLHCLPILL